MATEAEVSEKILSNKIAEKGKESTCDETESFKELPKVEGDVGICEGESFLVSPSLAKVAIENTCVHSESTLVDEKIILQQKEVLDNETQLPNDLKQEAVQEAYGITGEEEAPLNIDEGNETLKNKVILGQEVETMDGQASTRELPHNIEEVIAVNHSQVDAIDGKKSSGESELELGEKVHETSKGTTEENQEALSFTNGLIGETLKIDVKDIREACIEDASRDDEPIKQEVEESVFEGVKCKWQEKSSNTEGKETGPTIANPNEKIGEDKQEGHENPQDGTTDCILKGEEISTIQDCEEIVHNSEDTNERFHIPPTKFITEETSLDQSEQESGKIEQSSIALEEKSKETDDSNETLKDKNPGENENPDNDLEIPLVTKEKRLDKSEQEAGKVEEKDENPVEYEIPGTEALESPLVTQLTEGSHFQEQDKPYKIEETSETESANTGKDNGNEEKPQDKIVEMAESTISEEAKDDENPETKLDTSSIKDEEGLESPERGSEKLGFPLTNDSIDENKDKGGPSVTETGDNTEATEIIGAEEICTWKMPKDVEALEQSSQTDKPEEEKIEKSLGVVSEAVEAAASSADAERSTMEKEEPINSVVESFKEERKEGGINWDDEMKEHRTPKDENLRAVEPSQKIEKMEIESPNMEMGNSPVSHSLVEESIQEVCEQQEEVSNLEVEEQVHEENRNAPVENKHIEEEFRMTENIKSTMLEQETSRDGSQTLELIPQESEMEVEDTVKVSELDSKERSTDTDASPKTEEETEENEAASEIGMVKTITEGELEEMIIKEDCCTPEQGTAFLEIQTDDQNSQVEEKKEAPEGDEKEEEKLKEEFTDSEVGTLKNMEDTNKNADSSDVTEASREEILQNEHSKKFAVSEEHSKEDLEKGENNNEQLEAEYAKISQEAEQEGKQLVDGSNLASEKISLVTTETSSTIFQHVDVNSAKLQETHNESVNAEKALKVEKQDAYEGDKRKECEIQMESSDTFIGFQDKGIEATNGTEITASEAPLDNRWEETLQGSATLASRQELDSIEKSKETKDESPMQENNLEFPYLANSTGEISIQKEEPWKLEDLSKMDTNEIGEESTNEELQEDDSAKENNLPESYPEKNTSESKDTDEILKREEVTELTKLGENSRTENLKDECKLQESSEEDDLDGEKPFDVVSKGAETISSCASIEKDVLDQEDHVKNLDKIPKEGIIGSEKVENMGIKLEDEDQSHERDEGFDPIENSAFQEKSEDVDSSQKLERVCEVVAEDQSHETLPGAKENKIKEDNMVVEDQNTAAVEEQMIMQRLQEAEKDRINVEDTGHKLEAKLQTGKDDIPTETTKTSILNGVAHCGYDKAESSQLSIEEESTDNDLHTVSIEDRTLNEVKDSVLLSIDMCTQEDVKTETLDLKTVEYPNKEPEASPITEILGDITQRQASGDSLDISKSIAEVSEEKIREYILKEAETRNDKLSIASFTAVTEEIRSQESEKLVGATDIGSEEMSQRTVETGSMDEEVNEVKLAPTPDSVIQLPSECDNAHEESKKLENMDPYEVEEEVERSSNAVSASEHQSVKAITEAETTPGPPAMVEESEENLPEPSVSGSEQDLGSKTTNQNIRDEMLEDDEPLGVKNSVGLFTLEEKENMCLQREEPMELEQAPKMGFQDIEKGSPTKEQEEKEGQKPDEPSKLDSEIPAIEAKDDDSFLERERNTEPNEACNFCRIETSKVEENEILVSDSHKEESEGKNFEIPFNKMSGEVEHDEDGEKANTGKDLMEKYDHVKSPKEAQEEEANSFGTKKKAESSHFISEEQETETPPSTDKIDTSKINDEADKDHDALPTPNSPAEEITKEEAFHDPQEVTQLVPKELILGINETNEENREGAAEDKNVVKELIEVQKCNNTSSNLVSNPGAIVEDLHPTDQEVPTNDSNTSAFTEAAQEQAPEKGSQMTEDEGLTLEFTKKATGEVNLPKEAIEGDPVKDEGAVKETSNKEGGNMEIYRFVHGTKANEGGKTLIPGQEIMTVFSSVEQVTAGNPEEHDTTTNVVIEEQNHYLPCVGEETVKKVHQDEMEVNEVDEMATKLGDEDKSQELGTIEDQGEKVNAEETLNREILNENVSEGLDKGDASTNGGELIMEKTGMIKEPFLVAMGEETRKECHHEEEKEGNKVNGTKIKLDLEDHSKELDAEEDLKDKANEANKITECETLHEEVSNEFKEDGSGEKMERHATEEEAMKDSSLASTKEETVREDHEGEKMDSQEVKSSDVVSVNQQLEKAPSTDEADTSTTRVEADNDSSFTEASQEKAPEKGSQMIGYEEDQTLEFTKQAIGEVDIPKEAMEGDRVKDEGAVKETSNKEGETMEICRFVHGTNANEGDETQIPGQEKMVVFSSVEQAAAERILKDNPEKHVAIEEQIQVEDNRDTAMGDQEEKTNPANETQNCEILNEDVSEGFDKAGASTNIGKQIMEETEMVEDPCLVSIGEETYKESPHEDEKDGNKVNEPKPKLELEDQSQKLDAEGNSEGKENEAKMATKCETLDEEESNGFEGAGSSERMERQMTEEEAMKDIYSVPIREETVGEDDEEEKDSQEVEKEETKLNPVDQNNETRFKDGATEKEIINKEVKIFDVVLEEQQLETTSSTNEADTTTIKNEADRDLDASATPNSPAEEPSEDEAVNEPKEVILLVPKELIHGINETNEKNKEGADEGDTVKDCHPKDQEVPTNNSDASSLTEASQERVPEKEGHMTEDEERSNSVILKQASVEVNPSTEETEGDSTNDKAQAEDILYKEGEKMNDHTNVQETTCRYEGRETLVQEQEDTVVFSSVEQATAEESIKDSLKDHDITTNLVIEEQSLLKGPYEECVGDETVKSAHQDEKEGKRVDEEATELEAKDKGQDSETIEDQMEKIIETSDQPKCEILNEEVPEGLENASTTENIEKHNMEENRTSKDPCEVSIEETCKECHHEDKKEGEMVNDTELKQQLEDLRRAELAGEDLETKQMKQIRLQTVKH
ncbi:titin-like isoform X2 [Macadamia integrifolia]|uniref:titin-like isoform X2 n=1 Tax=Macadamia integrifolia TaxID=60698 RepID=UPI001C5340B0|nr:titin-like isoform X2 [Macadamia integrifolia]